MDSQSPDDNKLPVTLEDLDRAPDSTGKAQFPQNSPEAQQLWDRFTNVTNENFILLEENAKLKREKSTSDTLNKLAAPYARNAFRFMCGYSIGVFIILLLDGFGVRYFDLEQELMQILVGSTAATVIGLVATVLSGIFLSRPK